jgi:hypothetical protein
VSNEHNHFGAQKTVHDFEGLTGLLEIRHRTQNQSHSIILATVKNDQALQLQFYPEFILENGAVLP